MNTESKNTLVKTLALALTNASLSGVALDAIADNLVYHSDDAIFNLMDDVIYTELKEREHQCEAGTIRTVIAGLMLVNRCKYPEKFPNNVLEEAIPEDVLKPITASVFDLDAVINAFSSDGQHRFLANVTLLDFKDKLSAMLKSKNYSPDDIENRLNTIITLSLGVTYHEKIEYLVWKLED